MHKFHDVRDVQISPDGKWVAYTVSSVDTAADKGDTDVWMASWDGTQQLRLTSSPESENAPRWSPDGRYLAFLSGRPGKAKGSQVWLLDLAGGEPRKLTDLSAGVQDPLVFSTDGRKLAFVSDVALTFRSLVAPNWLGWIGLTLGFVFILGTLYMISWLYTGKALFFRARGVKDKEAS